MWAVKLRAISTTAMSLETSDLQPQTFRLDASAVFVKFPELGVKYDGSDCSKVSGFESSIISE